eukprot:GFYU01056989.1.p2 GENE.GFYU01056989.1~~GFYU01056989.1.p2  ORF type:complete len:148 (-),score=0.67 GFYU01056989.1:394-837(-)
MIVGSPKRMKLLSSVIIIGGYVLITTICSTHTNTTLESLGEALQVHYYHSWGEQILEGPPMSYLPRNRPISISEKELRRGVLLIAPSLSPHIVAIKPIDTLEYHSSRIHVTPKIEISTMPLSTPGYKEGYGTGLVDSGICIPVVALY